MKTIWGYCENIEEYLLYSLCILQLLLITENSVMSAVFATLCRDVTPLCKFGLIRGGEKHRCHIGVTQIVYFIKRILWLWKNLWRYLVALVYRYKYVIPQCEFCLIIKILWVWKTSWRYLVALVYRYKYESCLYFSNTAGNDIAERTITTWKSNLDRESIRLKEMEEVIRLPALNNKSMLPLPYLKVFTNLIQYLLFCYIYMYMAMTHIPIHQLFCH